MNSPKSEEKNDDDASRMAPASAFCKVNISDSHHHDRSDVVHACIYEYGLSVVHPLLSWLAPPDRLKDVQLPAKPLTPAGLDDWPEPCADVALPAESIDR